MNSNPTTADRQAPSDMDPYARWLIRHKVRRLVGRHGIRRGDEDDLAQDLALHAHLAAPKYDPARGAKTTTFYDRVLARKISSIVAARTAQKRDPRREQPIEDALEHSPRARELSPEQRDLHVDVCELLARLPEDHRRVAHLFMEHTEAQVIRASGLTRQKVRGIRGRIGDMLVASGIGVNDLADRQPIGGRNPYVSGNGRRRAVHHARHRAGRQAKARVGKSPKGDAPCA